MNKESLVRTLNEQIGPYEYNRDDNWTKKLSLGDFMSESQVKGSFGNVYSSYKLPDMKTFHNFLTFCTVRHSLPRKRFISASGYVQS